MADNKPEWQYDEFLEEYSLDLDYIRLNLEQFRQGQFTVYVDINDSEETLVYTLKATTMSEAKAEAVVLLKRLCRQFNDALKLLQ